MPSPADRHASALIAIRSRTTGPLGRDEEAGFMLTAQNGSVLLDHARLNPEVTGVAPASLAVWDAGTRGVPLRRRGTLRMRLPDNQVAIVTREALEDGTPTTMRVRVGAREFVWRRTWVRHPGANRLVQSEVESYENGVRVTRTVLAVSPQQLSATRARRDARVTAQLLAMSRRFGSIAGTVLLPQALHAQTDGMVCNGAALALQGAWLAWRIATVNWFASMVTGGVLKATALEFTASAAVEVAQSNYIDCYVAAAKAGVPDRYIAPPPVEDEL